MKCIACGLEMAVDHLEGEKCFFVCMNPNCTLFLQAVTTNGEKGEAMMKEK